MKDDESGVTRRWLEPISTRVNSPMRHLVPTKGWMVDGGMRAFGQPAIREALAGAEVQGVREGGMTDQPGGQLGPCPRCGKREGELIDVKIGRFRWLVICLACGWSTGAMRIKGVAVRRWNEAKPARSAGQNGNRR